MAIIDVHRTWAKVEERLATETDPVLDDEEDWEPHYQLYTFQGRAGQQLVITMDSDEFDTYLAFGPLAGTALQVTDYDDDGGEETNARLRVNIPADGTYGIQARAFGPDRGEPAVTQDLEVLRHRRLGERQIAHDVAAGTAVRLSRARRGGRPTPRAPQRAPGAHRAEVQLGHAADGRTAGPFPASWGVPVFGQRPPPPPGGVRRHRGGGGCRWRRCRSCRRACRSRP